MEQMTIGLLEAAAGVNVETVRYYHRRRPLHLPERAGGRIGRYPAGALTRLRFIKRSLSLGFSLDDVQALLSLDYGQACKPSENTSSRMSGSASRPCRRWNQPCNSGSLSARRHGGRSAARSSTRS